MALHSERLLDHFQNPRNVGQLPPPAVTVEVTNPACGDILRVAARLADGEIREARYEVRGCTASIAAGSALTVWMLDKTPNELAGLTSQQIEEALGGLQAASKHVAVLCVDAARKLSASLLTTCAHDPS